MLGYFGILDYMYIRTLESTLAQGECDVIVCALLECGVSCHGGEIKLGNGVVCE